MGMVLTMVLLVAGLYGGDDSGGDGSEAGNDTIAVLWS